MKTKMIRVAFVAAIAMVSGINFFKAQNFMNLSKTALANVEALAAIENLAGGESSSGESTSNSVADCDVYVYNRGYMESYKDVQIDADAEAKGFIEVIGRIVNLGASARIGGWVRIPYCESSSNNCCIKSHIEKPVQYL